MTGMPPPLKRPPKRWLKLRAVADAMQVQHPSQHYRVQFVRRLLRRLEKRDGTAYLMRFGSGQSGLYVSPSALEHLAPYSPGAVGQLREDVANLQEQHADLKRQISSHGSRIRNLEKEQRLSTTYLTGLAKLKGQTGA